MYNRYTPQQDGSFQHSRMPDREPQPPRRQENRRPPEPPQHFPEPPKPAPVCPPPPPEPHCQQNECRKPEKPCHQEPPCHTDKGLGSFFGNLIPKDMDSGDLIMLLILLLLLSDGSDNAPPALLTLALFFLL